MSTPAGNCSRISVSTVRELGSMMSMSRLCVRISNCSRESLSTNGDLFTVNFLISVGSGTGPATDTPVRSAASTICSADWSRMRWSNAFSLMRIFCLGMFSRFLAAADDVAPAQLLGHMRRDRRVVVKLHGVCCAALAHGAQVGRVTECLRQGNFCLDDLQRAESLDINDVAAACV